MSVKSFGRIAAAHVGLVAVAAAWSGAYPAAAAMPDSDRVPHESYFYMSCEDTPCRRLMYRVPEDRRLEVFALSCAAQVSSPGSVSHIGVRRQRTGGGEEVMDIASNRVGVQGNTEYFAFRSGAPTSVESGDRVHAFVDSTGAVGAFYCFLAGDLVVVR